MPPPADARLADALLADAVTAIRKTSGSFAAKAQDDSLGQVFGDAAQGNAGPRPARRTSLAFRFSTGSTVRDFSIFAATHRDLVADADDLRARLP